MKNLLQIALVLILFFGCIEKIEPLESYERQNLKFYKGVWMPAIGSPLPVQSLEKSEDLLNDNMNIIMFGPTISYEKDGSINKEEWQWKVDTTINQIRYYHKKGLAVWIVPQTQEANSFGEPGPLTKSVLENNNFLEQYDSLMINLAEKLEEEKVEIFSPLNEPDYRMGDQKSSEWGQQILPKIREKFKGKIIWKGSLYTAFMQNSTIDFKGYDGIGISTSPYTNDLVSYRQFVKYFIKTLNEWADRDNVSTILVSEFGVWGSGFNLTEQQQTESYKIVLEEGRGKVDGLVVLDYPLNGLKGKLAENIIREEFANYKS